MAIGEVAVQVGVAVARAEPLAALAAHLDDLVEQRARAVLGVRVTLPEPEAAPVVGGDVRDAVLGAHDVRLVPGGRGGRGRVGGDAAASVADGSPVEG